MLSPTLLTTTLLLALGAHARTDIEGCTSFTSTVTVRPEPGYGNTYNTIIWYVPDTLEICKGVDCGGGRAPPKAVPGCGSYHGTETVTPEFLTEDPMKPTQAVESDGAKETGKDGDDEGHDEDVEKDDKEQKDEEDDEKENDKEDDKEEESSTTTMTTSSKPAENASVQTTPASESESKKSDKEEEKTESKTESEAESTATGEEGAEQTGDDEDSGAAVMGASGLLAGAALAVVAML